ncbi:NACHT domain-containing protein [Saccharothrix xinjiangensis]|uniref:NACHT domain-containing protein n=1 Tax=Saccharothrix xinjiangensis TaxID=204798 RepID=A0ABV9YA04_9PSEU
MLLEVAVKALAGAAAKPALDAVARQEKVVALLKKLRLEPAVPPRDFEGIYVYALVEHCYGKPGPVVEFFRNEYVKRAFFDSFSTGDPSHLDREAEGVIDWNDETGALGHLGRDFRRDCRREFAKFTAVFNALVDRSRGAAEARAERKIDGLQDQLSELDRKLASLASIEEVREVATTPAAGQSNPLEWLAAEVKAWFDAIGYPFERHQEPSSSSFEWIIQVPLRRRYDRVVVLGVVGELSASHLDRARRSLEDNRADEAWVIAPRRVSPAAREAADDRVACYTLDELIDQDANFDGYLEWLQAEVARRRIDTDYVAMHCRKTEYDGGGEATAHSTYEAGAGGLDGYVDSWLADPSKEHLSVLGEFGTGKSWFCLHFASRLAARYQEAKRRGLPRPRLPLLIPLRDYAKAVSVESLFSEFFFRKHEVKLANYSVFEYLNRSGRLLLIFDGFDEMASRVDRQARINNFWELAKAVVPGAKVLLTCRTEHFPEARESRDLLNAQLKASTQALTGAPPQFEVLDLLPFDDDQVRELLGHITTPDVIDVITGHEELRDLMRRPVMSELVLDALPEIAEGRQVDLARVYLYAVRRKIARDINSERTFTSMSDKVFFLSELSWEMLSTDTMSMNYRQFPDRIRTCFGAAVQEEKDLDHWHHDMLGQTMLIRNSDGDYSPAHRSLLEFFSAYKLAAELGVLNEDFLTLVKDGGGGAVAVKWSEYFHRENGDAHRPFIGAFETESTDRLVTTFGAVILSPVVVDLMRVMVDAGAGEQVLRHLLEQTKPLPTGTLGLVGGNAATLLTQLDRCALRGADLKGADLRRARLSPTSSGYVDLTGAVLAGADLEGGDLEGAILVDVDLTSTSLAKVVDFGLEGWYPCSIATGRHGLVVGLSDESLLHWPGADPEGEPRELLSGGVFPVDASHAQIEFPFEDSRLAMWEGSTLSFLDVVDGRSQVIAEKTLGYIEVMSGDYRGFLVQRGDGEKFTWEIVHVDGTPPLRIGNITDQWVTGYRDETGQVFVIDSSGVVCPVRIVDDIVSVEPTTRLDLQRAGVADLPRPVFAGDYFDGMLAVYSYRGENLSLFAPSGELIRSIGLSFGDLVVRPSEVLLSSSKTVVVHDGRDFAGIDVETGELLWQDSGYGFMTMAAAANREDFVVVGRYGEVSIRRARTGEVRWRTSVGRSNVGLKLSRDCGLSEEKLEALERAGAVIV